MAPDPAQNRSPIMKSRLPRMTKTLVPAAATAAIAVDDLAMGRLGIVVADPGLEQVAEQEQRARTVRRA